MLIISRLFSHKDTEATKSFLCVAGVFVGKYGRSFQLLIIFILTEVSISKFQFFKKLLVFNNKKSSLYECVIPILLHK